MKNVAKGRKTVKGAVLFTVVGVMSVLLIFLLATLSVVMAVQKRTASDYSSSQSYYTARSALDSVKEALSGKTTESNALAKAIYAWKGPVGSQKAVSLTGFPASMGQITALTIEVTGDTWDVPLAPDQTISEQNKRTVYKLSATARVGDEEATVSTYFTWNALTSSSGSPGGKYKLPNSGMVTAGTAAAGTNAPLYGTATLSLLAPTDIDLTNASQLSGALTCYGNLNTGTSSAKYMLGTGDGLIVYNNHDNAYGNLHIKNTTGVFGNLNLKVNGATSYGDQGRSSSMQVVTAAQLERIKSYTLQDGIALIPYIYCDNVFRPGDSGSEIGYRSGTDIFAPVNIYCGSVDTRVYDNGGNLVPGNGFSNGGFVGDIFCYDKTGTSVMSRTNTNSIIGWTAEQLGLSVGDTTVISGNMYTDGNLSIEKGDWVIEGNLYVGGNITVTGGSLTVTGRCNKEVNGVPADTTLNFPSAMKTYTVGGKDYPGVVKHTTANPNGFITSYEDAVAQANIDSTRTNVNNLITSAGATLNYMPYTEAAGEIIVTENARFDDNVGWDGLYHMNSNIVADLRKDETEKENVRDIYLYFPIGCNMSGKSITALNLVGWQYVTDADGYILDASGTPVTDMADAVTQTVPSGKGYNNKLPVQTYSLDPDTGQYKAVAAKCRIVVAKDKDFISPLAPSKILSEYYTSARPLDLYEDGSEHPEQIPCIELYMSGGTFYAQNNTMITGYAYCLDAHLDSNTSGSKDYAGTTHTSFHDSAVEVNTAKDKFIFWIGGMSFSSIKTINDTAVVAISTPGEGTLPPTSGEWVIDEAGIKDPTRTDIQWVFLGYIYE